MITIPDQQLSKYFKLSDLTKSDSHPDIDNTPSTMYMANLQNLALMLDQIYDNLGSFTVNSAYRSPALNAAISGSSSTSNHMTGQAADIMPDNSTAYDYFLMLIRSSFLGQLGQIINETNTSGIVHISLPTSSHPGGQVLYADDSGYHSYSTQAVTDLINPPDPTVPVDPTQYIDPTTDVPDTTEGGEDAPSASPVALIMLAGAVFLVIMILMKSRKNV